MGQHGDQQFCAYAEHLPPEGSHVFAKRLRTCPGSYILTNNEVPTHQKAFENLVEIHESGKDKYADAAASELRKRAAQFIKLGIELDSDR